MIGSRPARTTFAAFVATLLGVACWTATTTAAHASTTKQLTVRFYQVRVVLTVPTSWHISQTAPSPYCGCGGDYQPVCIVDSGDYDRNPNNCELVIGGNGDTQRFDYPTPGARLPRCDSWTTTYEADSRIGARPAQYRIFLDRCHDRKSEQWTSLTVPSVSIWHPLSWTVDDDIAANAVQNTQLSGRSLEQRRVTELGYVRRVFVRDGHTFVRIDRAVLSLSGHITNHSPQTYLHRIFETPRVGRLVEMRNFGRWSVDRAYRWAFQSWGDDGHCGC